MHAKDDVVRLQRLLGGPETAWLVRRVRARLGQGQEGRLTGAVQLREPSADQRAAIMRIVGAPRRPGATLRVDLGELEDLLRRGVWPDGLADAVAVLTGPVPNRPRERVTADAAWANAQDAFNPAILVHPTLADWWQQWCTAGHLKRAARSDPSVARRLALDAATCLRALPSSGEPLAVFARRTTGDAHGLDRARPLGRVVLAAVGALGEVDANSAADDALGPREIWASVGLLVSAVSSTVLCLGVPGEPSAETGGTAGARATAIALSAWRSAGLPVVLTLEQVRSGGIGVVPAGDVIHACENPSVVEVVADELTRRGRPDAASMGPPVLICTYGQPGAAVLELLDHLTAAGAGVRYHGDFDWAGLRIASTLAAHTPWEPWRFRAPDYASAVHGLDSQAPDITTERERLPLRGAPAASAWDPALADAMYATGVAIEEEEVIALLVTDLVPSLLRKRQPHAADR
ncbi:MAG: TIGR02679 family protein [Cellulomonas sp.]